MSIELSNDFAPSVLAISALYLAKKLLKYDNPILSNFIKRERNNRSDKRFKLCIKKLYKLLRSEEN